MLYGAAGSLLISDIAAVISAGDNLLLMSFGMTFALVGVAFKFGAAPFHMWVPDVYQGAPTGGYRVFRQRAESRCFGIVFAPARRRPR
jgi:NADH dehydrogenase subunit N (EC 1.6.5.3)